MAAALNFEMSHTYSKPKQSEKILQNKFLSLSIRICRMQIVRLEFNYPDYRGFVFKKNIHCIKCRKPNFA